MAITHFENIDRETVFNFTGNCAEVSKPIVENITFDDGFGNEYTTTVTKYVTYQEYTITPDFITNPNNPTIEELTSIIPQILDPYNVVETSGVDYDLSADGNVLSNEELDVVQRTLTTPRTQVLRQDVRYFSGWDIKTASITKSTIKTNIAPQVCYDNTESGVCTPRHLYTGSCTVDAEDIINDLTFDWELFIDTNSTVVEVNQVKSIEHGVTQNWVSTRLLEDSLIFDHVFSDEGYYKLVETVEDTDGGVSTLERLFDITYDECGGDSVISQSGEIQIEPGVWQLLAIPQKTGYWDNVLHKMYKDENTISKFENVVITQIEDTYGVQASTVLEVANAYIGDENLFRNYIPGLTSPLSVHNFELVYIDIDGGNTREEVTAFWVKSIGATPIILKWGF
jgi:hypothetical protein